MVSRVSSSVITLGVYQVTRCGYMSIKIHYSRPVHKMVDNITYQEQDCW